LLAVLGIAIGASAADLGPLAGLRLALQGTAPPPASWTPPFALSLAAGLGLAGLLGRTRDRRAGAWSWRRTGLWIGAVATIAWPVSAAAGRQFGLAVVPGTTGLLAGSSGRLYAPWDAALVLGIMTGGWLAARAGGTTAASAQAPSVLLKRFTGGLGLGVGAAIASGCTVGHGLTGLALLAPGSVLATASIFAGSAFVALVARRSDPQAPAAHVLSPTRAAPDH
jgi:hypothetical protein